MGVQSHTDCNNSVVQFYKFNNNTTNSISSCHLDQLTLSRDVGKYKLDLLKYVCDLSFVILNSDVSKITAIFLIEQKRSQMFLFAPDQLQIQISRNEN